MIQRIQTLYLLVSAVLIGSLFVLPFAEIVKDGTIYVFNVIGIVSDGIVKQDGTVVSILIGVIMALHSFAILNYKKRKIQIRIVVFSMILMLVLFGLFIFFPSSSFKGAQISYKIGIVFPLVAIILDYLAFRAIRKDEALVRSLDRIR